MRYKFQIITFEDHYHDAEWVDPVKYRPKPEILQYCGWVIRETDTLIVLSQGKTIKEYEEDVEYDGHMHIMKSCILKRKNYKI